MYRLRCYTLQHIGVVRTNYNAEIYEGGPRRWRAYHIESDTAAAIKSVKSAHRRTSGPRGRG